MKPNAEHTEILNHFRPQHLEETIKENKSGRGRENIWGNIDMSNKHESSRAFKDFSL